MKKLVAIDLDGTLLDDHKNLPKDFEETVQALAKKDVQIVLASGRYLHSIKSKVEHINADFYFISDNGALVEHEGDIIYKSYLEGEDLSKTLKVSRETLNTTIVATTSSKESYVELASGHDAFERLDEYYQGFKLVDDIEKIEAKFTRLALNSDDNIRNYQDILKPKLATDYQVVLSGDVWTDITHKGVSKGQALQQLMKVLGLDVDDVYAFGDYDNDISMLRVAGHSFAMQDATEAVKSVADHIIGSNNDQAVTKTLKELFL